MENKFLPSPVGEGAVVFENVSSKTTNVGEVWFLRMQFFKPNTQFFVRSNAPYYFI